MARPLPPLVQIVKALKGGEASLAACAAALLLEAGLLPAAAQLQQQLVLQVGSAFAAEAGLDLQSLGSGPQLIAPTVTVR